MTRANDWKFCQVFGDDTPPEQVKEEDVISNLQFSRSGDLFAAGDCGGRIVMFKREDRNRTSSKKRSNVQYRFFSEFQAYDRDFDTLRSIEISEKVNCIEWCEPQSGHQFLLTANDKTVKLWRVGVKQVKRATMDDVTRPGPGRLHVPTVVPGRTLVATTLRRQFQNAHSFHINSLSTSPDGSTFLSADDLNVHLWDIERPETAFNPINIQPENMNDLAEVITTAKFHPTQSATFCYGTSKGLIRLCDLRSRALCGQGGLVFGTSTSPRSFYQDIASVVSDMEYHPDGRHLITRDFMGMKTWDLAMPGAPIKSVDVHQHLTPHMPRLYDEDSLFDRFRCSISPTGSHAITGSYSNTFHVVDLATKADVAIEASRDLVGGKRRAKPRARNATDLPHLDRAIFQVGWHPTDPILTVATFTNVYLFAV